MNLENQNNEENNLNKSEIGNLQERQAGNTEKSIESELNQIETKGKQFEANLDAAGGEEGVQKIWGAMDEAGKKEIVSKIEDYKKYSKLSNEEAKDMAITAGLSTLLLACGIGGFASGVNEAQMLGGLSFAGGGIFVALPATFMAIKEKIKSLQYKHVANKEERKLA